MQNRIGVLAAVAALQILVIAWFWFADSDQAGEAQTLLEFDVNQVQQLTISSADGEVQVVRHGEDWQVAQAPADAQKIAGLLDKLAQLDATWPVGRSDDIAERFEVGESNYQRRVSLHGDDELLAQAYFGTSPGYQRVHARLAQSQPVYAVKLSNYELGLNVDAWLDKAVMAATGQVTQVALRAPVEEAQILEQALDESGLMTWQFQGAAADATKAETYVNRFGNLRVLGLAEPELVSSADLLAHIEVTTDAGTLRYEISGVRVDEAEATAESEADGSDSDLENKGIDEYLIKREDVSQAYRLATYVAEQLLMQDTDFISI